MAKETVEEVLAHYGIPGMKWGVRRTSSELARARGAESVTVKTRPGKGVTEVSGGRRQPVTEEAKRAAAILQVAKKSGTSSLTNAEIGELTKRLELERKYSQLVPQKQSRFKRGDKFVKEVLSVGATANSVVSFANSPAGKNLAGALGKNTGKHVKR